MHLIDSALAAGLLTDDAPCAFLFDVDGWLATLDELAAAFPPGTLHALAVKCNPVGKLLRMATARGFGLEAASAGELELALRCAPPDRVVLDSPAKTRLELAAALRAGVHVNLDNLQEVARVAEMRPPGRVGLRVNPVVGAGTWRSTSTAMPGSKFGVDLALHRAEVIAAFRDHAWLTGLHVHVGSAGCDLDLLARGVAATVALAEELGNVTMIDIGGGMPVEPTPPSFAEYARHLPSGLFCGRWRVATEFGRRVFGPHGLFVSRVEYTKRSGDRNIAIIHGGADLFVRAVFAPDDSDALRVRVLGADGAAKDAPVARWDIAGPLCFSGDVIARDRELPAIEPGDLVVVEGAGAYTFAHSTRYNSRPLPPIHGWWQGKAQLLHPGQTVEEVADFWDR